YSDDSSCSWHIAGGLLSDQSVTDYFADPSNADRVVAIALKNAVYGAFESTDGGTTFGRMLYQAAAGDAVSGIEISQSGPMTVYLSLLGAAGNPRLARSPDGGAHWTVADLTADLGAGLPRIISVDPAHPGTVVLRLLASTNQSLAI